LAIGLASVGLLPFIPVLPGVGGLVALALGLLALRRAAPRRWLVVAAMFVGGAGFALALLQLAAALAAALGIA